MPKKYKILEFKIIDRFHGVDAILLNDAVKLAETIIQAARTANMKCENLDIHFYPAKDVPKTSLEKKLKKLHGWHGLSLTLIVSASHLSLHTYPEEDFVSVEVAVCNSIDDARKAHQFLKEALKPEYCDTVELPEESKR